MMELPRQAGTPMQSIIVQTSKGSDIPNYLGGDATQFCRNRFELLQKTHGRNWMPRKPATGGYNCAGLVWASRRAVLDNPASWKTILEDDRYRRLVSNESAQVGDVVVYWNEGRSEIIHVARVCAQQFLHVGDSRIPICKALSKWDPSLGESIHALSDVHLMDGEPFISEIYTDRPE